MLEASLGATIVGFLAVTVIAGWAAGLLRRVRNSLGRLEATLPGKQDLSSLARSLDTHRQVVQQLPEQVGGRIASEVSSGLGPLSQELHSFAERQQATLGRLSEALATSHDHFTRTVMTLDHDGSLGEWVASLRETTRPFQSAAEALEHQYTTTGEILTTTGRLVAECAGQREAVQLAFDRFSQVVESSAAAETSHLRDIEHRVMNRLEEVAETNSTVAQSLSALQTASREMIGSHTTLARSVEETVKTAGDLIELGRHTQAQHHELVRTQQEVQHRLKGWQEEMSQGVADFQRRMQEVPAEVAASLAAKTRETLAAVSQLGDQLQTALQTYGAAMDKIRKEHQAVTSHQVQLAQRQQAAIEEAEELMGRFPSRANQVALVVLMAVQSLLTGLVIYGIFQLT